jgi:hypothetical protein
MTMKSKLRSLLSFLVLTLLIGSLGPVWAEAAEYEPQGVASNRYSIIDSGQAKFSALPMSISDATIKTPSTVSDSEDLANSITDMASTLPSPLLLPFSIGEEWYICQGYNGPITHMGQPWLDLTVDEYALAGDEGCDRPGDLYDDLSAGKTVVAPGSGILRHRAGQGGVIDHVCIDFDEGGSMYLAHLDITHPDNTRVIAGAPIGKVSYQSEANGGYAHIHVQVHPAPGCTGATVPFDSANSARFECAPNLPYDGTENQHRKTKLHRCGITTDLLLRPGTVGEYYSVKLETGGVTPLATWSSVTSLPDGLTLDPTTGRISGWPAVVGVYSFVVQISDDGDRSAEKLFLLTIEPAPSLNLTVTKFGTGSGTVTSSPSGIECGADCTESLANGTVVTLSANPSFSSTFTGWGGACSGTGSCVVTMDNAKSVTATFSRSGGSLPGLVQIVYKSRELPSTGMICRPPMCVTVCSASTSPQQVCPMVRTLGVSRRATLLAVVPRTRRTSP